MRSGATPPPAALRTSSPRRAAPRRSARCRGAGSRPPSRARRAVRRVSRAAVPASSEGQASTTTAPGRLATVLPLPFTAFHCPLTAFHGFLTAFYCPVTVFSLPFHCFLTALSLPCHCLSGKYNNGSWTNLTIKPWFPTNTLDADSIGSNKWKPKMSRMWTHGVNLGQAMVKPMHNTDRTRGEL